MLSDEEALKVLDSNCAQLMEHFDSVRIFVTKHDSLIQTTQVATRGKGNYFASRGYIQDWITQQDENTREECRYHEED